MPYITKYKMKGVNMLKDFSDLDDRFTRYYESGERVEVTWKPGYGNYSGYGSQTEGRKARFYVGRSTGWKPIYLSLLRRDSTGGTAISSYAVDSVHGLGVYK
jgi:hypothetical protein